MSKNQYGTYAILAFDQDTPKEQKLEMLKAAIPKLIDDIGAAEAELDLNTLQLIIKEGFIDTSDDPTWYADEEEDYTPSLPFWGMTVGLKCTEREEEDGNIRTAPADAPAVRHDGPASYGCVYEGKYEGQAGR